jgi:hypothetical protein
LLAAGNVRQGDAKERIRAATARVVTPALEIDAGTERQHPGESERCAKHNRSFREATRRDGRVCAHTYRLRPPAFRGGVN